MSITFPAIKPASRDFTMGTYPTKVYRSLAGTTVKRSFGNKPSGYQLGLEFQNLPDETVSTILAHYNSTAGGFERFRLPNAVFAGMSDELRAYIQAPNGIRWEYAAPPEVESVFRGVSNVSINLIGELNA
jgi:hypothetical protein